MKKIVRRSLWGILAAVLLLDTPLIWSPGEAGTAEAASKSVSISRKKATVNKGFTYKLKLSNVPKGSKVAWSSSNKAVASVKASGSSCVVTGKKTGRTRLRQRSEAKSIPAR